MPYLGGLASIYVTGLAGPIGLTGAPSSSPLPYQLAGVEVSIDAVLAPVLAVYISGTGPNAFGQINIQVPVEWNLAAILFSPQNQQFVGVTQYLPDGSTLTGMVSPVPVGEATPPISADFLATRIISRSPSTLPTTAW